MNNIIDILDVFTMWNMIRFSGFMGLFFITFSIAFGLMSNLPWLKSKKALNHFIHLSSSWGAVVSTVFHLALLFFDTYKPFTLKDLFVPFQASFSPFATGLGTLAFYMIMVVYLTSEYGMKKLKREVWKKIHWLTLPAWLFVIIHGVMVGTDVTAPWAIGFYLVCYFTIVFLFIFRITRKKVVKKVVKTVR